MPRKKEFTCNPAAGNAIRSANGLVAGSRLEVILGGLTGALSDPALTPCATPLKRMGDAFPAVLGLPLGMVLFAMWLAEKPTSLAWHIGAAARSPR